MTVDFDTTSRSIFKLYRPERVNKTLTVNLRQVERKVTVDAPEPTTMYLRQAGLTRNPTFRIFNAFTVGDSAWLRKPRSNANTHVVGHAA